VARLDDHLAGVLLSEVLSEGDAARLQRRLVQHDRLVTDVSAYLGEFGDPFDERDPTAFTITAHYPDPASLERILAAVDEELARVATDGLEAGELDRVRTRAVSVLFRDMDAVLSRALEFAKFELIFGRAELISELPTRLAAVAGADVQAAAAALRPERRAVVELIAGAAR
jgi:predicted Zn-dependent peptidase